MNTHPDERTLNDLADGTLSAAERAEIEPHVRLCADCTRRVDAVRQLRAELGALPRDIAPPPDLLADIHAAIDLPVSRRSSGVPRAAWLSAAAVLLVVASSAVTVLIMQRERPPSVVQADSSRAGTVHLVGAHPLEQSYEHAIAELQRELAGQESALAPETRRIVETNLQTIDRAVAEARAALLADPANAALADMLRSGYERKLDVLRSAAAHTRPAS